MNHQSFTKTDRQKNVWSLVAQACKGTVIGKSFLYVTLLVISKTLTPTCLQNVCQKKFNIILDGKNLLNNAQFIRCSSTLNT